jgi:hypothetical protein
MLVWDSASPLYAPSADGAVDDWAMTAGDALDVEV